MAFSTDLLNALSDIINDTKWQKIGTVAELSKSPSTKLFVNADDEDMVVQPDDIALFWVGDDKFYAMDCSCPHEGGPLDLGDIEDLDGELSVICPWHSYSFSLLSGNSLSGLKTNVYDIKVVSGDVYINCDHGISLLNPSNGASERLKIDRSTDERQSNVTDDSSLTWYARKILLTADPLEKVKQTRDAFDDVMVRKINHTGSLAMPGQPRRKEGLEIKEPGQIKRGRGGTLQSRIALLHSLANIEQWAIDLAWDIIGRFSTTEVNGQALPWEFFQDFAKVANDEAKHFTMINKRLNELESYFGALPVHNGLWQSADETSNDILARLAIVHMVHEARGLDVHPKTSQRFASQNDDRSVELMKVIYEDEITHVACGMKWFTYICQHSSPTLDPVATFHKLVKKHFKGYLKPPFNTAGRKIAGMDEEWYTPLVNTKLTKT